MTKANTVFTQSSCPDELNHSDFDEDISLLMRQRWGEVFHLGGLAGVPFTGNTGWAAFSHHVPDGGNIFVLFAPHVGLTADGVVGKVHRPGMHHGPTTACGSAIGAYSALKADDTAASAPSGNMLDYQQEYVTYALAPRMKDILTATSDDEAMSKLAY